MFEQFEAVVQGDVTVIPVQIKPHVLLYIHLSISGAEGQPKGEVIMTGSWNEQDLVFISEIYTSSRKMFNLKRVSYDGQVLRLFGLALGAAIQMCIYDFEAIKGSMKTVNALRVEINELKDMVNQLYYAPGAPGFQLALHDWQAAREEKEPK